MIVPTLDALPLVASVTLMCPFCHKARANVSTTWVLCISHCSTGTIVPHSRTRKHSSLLIHPSLLWWYNTFHLPKR